VGTSGPLEKTGNLHHKKNLAKGNISSLRKTAGAQGEKNSTSQLQGHKELKH
jgi:hypothetical protein